MRTVPCAIPATLNAGVANSSEFNNTWANWGRCFKAGTAGQRADTLTGQRLCTENSQLPSYVRSMRGQAAPIKYPSIVQIIACNEQANAHDAKEQWQQTREKNCSCIADNTKEPCFTNTQITSATTINNTLFCSSKRWEALQKRFCRVLAL